MLLVQDHGTVCRGQSGDKVSHSKSASSRDAISSSVAASNSSPGDGLAPRLVEAVNLREAVENIDDQIGKRMWRLAVVEPVFEVDGYVVGGAGAILSVVHRHENDGSTGDGLRAAE